MDPIAGIMLVLIVGVLVSAAVTEHTVTGSQEVVADFSAIGLDNSPLAMCATWYGRTDESSGRIASGV